MFENNKATMIWIDIRPLFQAHM